MPALMAVYSDVRRRRLAGRGPTGIATVLPDLLWLAHLQR